VAVWERRAGLRVLGVEEDWSVDAVVVDVLVWVEVRFRDEERAGGSDPESEFRLSLS